MQIHTGPGGLILEIDTDNDATPAMVRSPCERFCATYDCAVAMGELEDYQLTGAQLCWLDDFDERIEEAMSAARPVGGKWQEEQHGHL